MEEKENRYNETEQEAIKDGSGVGGETKDVKETEHHIGMHGDGCILPDYFGMFLPIVILFLIIGLIFRLTEM